MYENKEKNKKPKQKDSNLNKDSSKNYVTQRQLNNTGLPDNLKSGIENLSGYSMDDVKVHYNSDKPAQLNAHAYAQGSDIHVASGQEKHLPHEAWHVVQQKQGRVKPTMQMKGKVNINDDEGLEREADVMGAKAYQLMDNHSKTIVQRNLQEKSQGNIIQKVWDGNESSDIRNWDEVLPPGLQWHWNNKTQKMYFTIPEVESEQDSEDIKRLRSRQNEEYFYEEWLEVGWQKLESIPKVQEVVEDQVEDEIEEEVDELTFAGNLDGEDVESIIKLLEKNYTNVKIATKMFLRSGKLGKKKYTCLDDVALKLQSLGAPLTLKKEVVLNFGEGEVFEEEKLKQVLEPLYENGGKPTKAKMLDAIRSLYKSDSIDEIVDSKEFVYGLQKIVREMIESQGGQNDFLGKTEITDLPEEDYEVESIGEYQMRDISKWTLRHYSAKGTDDEPPSFNDVKSAVSLGVKDTTPDTAGGHTGQVDWRKYGNVGNTFFLLYIDGHVVQKQKFLDNAKWYCEFNLADIPSLWVSSDWLDESGIKGQAIRGSGSNVQKKLLELGGKGDSPQFIQHLSGLYHNFEVKIPGSMAITEWKKA